MLLKETAGLDSLANKFQVIEEPGEEETMEEKWSIKTAVTSTCQEVSGKENQRNG